MKVTFRGDEADAHAVDLYSGSETLSGFGRVGNLVAHYIATGEVRFRAPYSDLLQYQLVGTEEGSLTAVITQVSRLANGAARELAIARSAKLLRRVLRRATGQAPSAPLDADGLTVPEGDIDVLAEAVTPALQRAHRWIDSNNKSIGVSPSDTTEIRFDEDTKKYLDEEDIDPSDSIQDVSVGALNVNSKNGRVFFHDLRRTVPFIVSKNAAGRTISTLARYLSQYAERTGATVNIRFRKVKYRDGRLKRIIISDCYAISGVQ